MLPVAPTALSRRDSILSQNQQFKRNCTLTKVGKFDSKHSNFVQIALLIQVFFLIACFL